MPNASLHQKQKKTAAFLFLQCTYKALHSWCGLQVSRARQQAIQELQGAQEQMDLQSQLLREQDSEVQKLCQLLDMERKQATAQAQQQACKIVCLQKAMDEQQQQALLAQKATALQAAEGVCCDSCLAAVTNVQDPSTASRFSCCFSNRYRPHRSAQAWDL